MAIQLPLGIRLREGLDFASFYSGPNAEPVAMAQRLALGEGAHSLYLWGGRGAGKTHLLQALCAQAGTGCAYVPLDDLIAMPPAVLEGLASVRLLCLDALETVAGRLDWERALVACIDALRQGGGRLVAAGRLPTDDLGLVLQDLSSRLAWGPVYALKPLTDGDKRAVLQLRARGRGLHMPDEVARYLLTRQARDLTGLLDLLDELDRASLAAQRRLTVPFAREVLARARQGQR